MKKSEFILSLDKNTHPLYLKDGVYVYHNTTIISQNSPLPYWENPKYVEKDVLLTFSQAMLAIKTYNRERGSTSFEFYWGEKRIKV